MIWKPHPINHYYAKNHLLITSIISSSSVGRLKTRMIWVGKLLLSCKWCKSMTSQLPLCNVKRDHEYLPTYLPTYLVRTITYCDLPPNERTEQKNTERNWFDSDGRMKYIHSFACFILSSFPAAPITTLLLSLRFCVQFCMQFWLRWCSCGSSLDAVCFPPFASISHRYSLVVLLLLTKSTFIS